MGSLLNLFWTSEPQPTYLDMVNLHLDGFLDSRSLQFLVYLILNWWFFRRQQHRLHRHYRQPLDLVSLSLSSYHAAVVSLYHVARLWLGHEIDPQLLIWSQSWSVAYALNDLLLIAACIRSIPRNPLEGQAPFRPRLRNSDKLAIAHHLGMIICVCTNYYTWPNLTAEVKDLWSLGYLAELSTPLLNLIKIKLRNGFTPGRYLTWMFILLYLACRPINFAYLSYRGWQIYGMRTVPALCFCFWLLNTYWFNLILRKYKKHAKTQ